jgi:tRNA-2-methylthio-N6-dimethylallyladenosine synthase
LKYVRYDYGFMYSYSERPGTHAARKIADDIPEPTKKRRLQEIIALQREHSELRTKANIGKTFCVLIEKSSKKSDKFWSGRTGQNTVAVFPKENYKVGEFVDVKIDAATSATLIGKAIGISQDI